MSSIINNEEIYAELKNYSKYLISNKGNIKCKFSGKVLKKNIGSHGYFTIYLSDDDNIKKQYLIHRLVCLTFLENLENKTIVDHIDCNTLNNDVNNLRYVTKSENAQNSKIPINNKTSYKGLSFNKRINKYEAYINLHGKKYHLGYFKKFDDAKMARYRKACEMFGDYMNQCERIN